MIDLEVITTHLRVDSPRPIERRIRALWAPFITTSDSVDHHVRFLDGPDAGAIELDGRLVPRGYPSITAIENFATVANGLALAGCPDLATHAAVVVGSKGAVAFPATSGAGKSTLSAACVRAGLTYASDEALRLSYDDGSVLPYPRPIALARDSTGLVGLSAPDDAGVEGLYAPSDLGAVAQAPSTLAHIVALDRRESIEPSLAPMHRADAIALLLTLSFNHFNRPSDSYNLAIKVVRQASAWRFTYSDPIAAAEFIHDHLG
jgi:hypothetical protein